ncbi:Rtf2 RING-finger-domain-containing protein [Chytriomyces sp. MP71]|nr:Rtf2 RING-finger-domain-containing protein [Chytriomyces sp. MP71]
MGNDGGSIPKRHELVTLKAKVEQPDKASQQQSKWRCCALSKDPLREPIVSCRLGRLYNKAAILEFLMDRDRFGDGEDVAGHVVKLKEDVFDLRLTASTMSAPVDANTPVWVCPVTLKEFGGRSRFVFHSECGCVLAEAAVTAVPSPTCLVCGEKTAKDGTIVINSEVKEELDRMRASVEALRIARLEAGERKKKAKVAKKGEGREKVLAGGNDSGMEGNKKRKEQHEGQGVTALSSAAAKKQAKSSSSSARANISIPLPLELEMKTSSAELAKNQSEAIKSLYAKNKDKPQGNYLTMGTFNRYSSY